MKRNYNDENPVVHLRSPVWKFAERLSKTSASCNFCDKMFTLHQASSTITITTSSPSLQYNHHQFITFLSFLNQASTKELKRHIAKKHVDKEGVYEALVAREAGEIRETEAETHLDINAKRLELNMKVEDSNVD